MVGIELCRGVVVLSGYIITPLLFYYYTTLPTPVIFNIDGHLNIKVTLFYRTRPNQTKVYIGIFSIDTVSDEPLSKTMSTVKQSNLSHVTCDQI